MNLSFVPHKYRPIVLPGLVLLVMLILTVTVGKAMVVKVLDSRTQIDELGRKNQALEAKKNILEEVGKTDLKGQVEAAVMAVPDDGSSLPALATLRGLAVKRNLGVVSARVNDKSTKANKGTNLADVIISLQGNLVDTLQFLNDVKKSSPLMKISTVDIALKESSASLNLVVSSVWGPLPKAVGGVDEPIEGLRTAEQEVVAKLKALERPTEARFNILGPQGRNNPFVF